MKVLRKAAITLLLATAIASLFALSGCAGTTGTKQSPLSPTLSLPAIKEIGVLKVGVNSGHPPFAGTYNSKIVGIDVDIASALAEKLGLKVTFVDMLNKSPDELLTTGAVDMIMDVELSGSAVTTGRIVGPYMLSGPALFMKTRSNEIPTINLQTLAGTKIATQKDSLSAWTVNEVIAKETANPMPSLADALKAVNDGGATYAAADAVVGSYLALDYTDLSCVKIIGTPIDVYCAVEKNNVTLAEALATAMRSIRNGGQLSIILSKWLGVLSSQVVISTKAIVSQNPTSSTNNSNGTTTGTDDGETAGTTNTPADGTSEDESAAANEESTDPDATS